MAETSFQSFHSLISISLSENSSSVNLLPSAMATLNQISVVGHAKGVNVDAATSSVRICDTIFGPQKEKVKPDQDCDRWVLPTMIHPRRGGGGGKGVCRERGS